MLRTFEPYQDAADCTAWTLFRQEWRRRFVKYKHKEVKLEWLGPFYHFNADGEIQGVSQRWAAEFQGKIRTKITTTRPTNPCDLGAQKPIMPHQFFNQKDRGVLRCIMGGLEPDDRIDEETGLLIEGDTGLVDSTGAWVELPGPAEWWPSATNNTLKNYYALWGFAPRTDLKDGYRKAL